MNLPIKPARKHWLHKADAVAFPLIGGFVVTLFILAWIGN